MMRVLTAMDSFKGSLESRAAGEAVRRGVLRACPNAQVQILPVADGGEGTVEALVSACGGTYRETAVQDPLGRAVTARWGLLPQPDGVQTAAIEMAAASGLVLVPPERRDPRITSTYGTGQLIRDALDTGCRRILLGLGGSATNDGGQGMLRALGARFLDENGGEIPEGGAALARLARIDLSGFDPRVKTCEFRVACDVDNPLCGPQGASAVFGPQKGATPDMVGELDAALANYAALAFAATGRDVRDFPGAGAAGGMGAACLAFLGAELAPGIELLLDAAGFDRLLDGADFVITGEGATDAQTLRGKAPLGVARRAAARGKPVFILSGGLKEGHEALYTRGVTAAFSIVPRPMPLAEAMENAAALLADAAERLARTAAAFMTRGSQ